MKPITILVAEDNPVTSKMIRFVLEKEGYAVLAAPTASDALRLAAEGPDLILLDLLLPDGTGADLVTELRATPASTGVPILAYSGLLSPQEEARAAALGFDGFIPKPIEPSRLLQIVRAHLPAATGRSVAGEGGELGRGRRLLLVDDDPVQLKLMRFRLARLGFEVTTARDGEEALELARKASPSVVVSDALMPRLDGFGLCVALRRDPALASVPVVLVTAAYVEGADFDLARQAGASALVVRTPDLGAVVRALSESLGAAPPTPSAPDAALGDLAERRAERALIQLERQVVQNAGLMQRCSILAAELAVLSGISNALVQSQDAQRALADILAGCLDAAGTSKGAIYLTSPEGEIRLRAQHGFGPEPRAELGSFFGQAHLLQQCAQADAILEIPSDAVDPEASRRILEGVGASVLVVPLTVGAERLGALVLGGRPRSLTDEDWEVFGRTVAGQVGVAIALSNAFNKIAASDQRHRALMESAQDAILIATAEGALLEINRAGEALLGRPRAELVGRDLALLLAPAEPGPERDRVARLLREETVRAEEIGVARPGGGVVPAELSSSLAQVGGERLLFAIVRDETRRTALAEQLRQTQKMEAIGKLAGGVAHDFNNMLSVVLSYSELLLADLPPGDPMAADLAEIRSAGQRAADLTGQLLAFSRQQQVQRIVLDVNRTIADLERMLRRLIGEHIELVAHLAPEPANVLADAGQLEQVVLNLAVNARDAMPRGGTLTIRTRTLGEGPAGLPGLGAGPCVVIEVADTGVGMDEATQARIFEPFFTTKAEGKGTGLGLATVFGVVQQSGGAIALRSRPGEGATFSVYLPESRAASVEARAAPPPPSTLRGSETILVVDDEDQVRKVACSILGRCGYCVLEAGNPGEALLVAEQHAGVIHLLLSDVVMPRMNGRELAARIRRVRPETRILLVSGYADAVVLPHDLADPELPLLQKPLTPEALMKKVRSVLGSPHLSLDPPGG